jgi:hypothetical protein
MTTHNAGKKARKISGNSEANLRPFKPGQSGNPSGRPKKTPEELDLIAACKEKTPQALSVIENVMVSGEQEKNRLIAAQYIIDRAYGKATQNVQADGDFRFEVILPWMQQAISQRNAG